MDIIKYTRSRIIQVLPIWLKVVLYKIWRNFWLVKTRMLPSSYHRDPYSKNGIIYINPQTIKHSMKKEFGIYRYKGRVLGGDWDKNLMEFDKNVFFNSFRQRFEDNTPWEDTEYYNRVLEQIRSGKAKWSCRSKEDLDMRCTKLDEIYKDMLENGYKKRWNEDEICVNIGRNGELIFNNGRHRLIFAKLLKMEKIPVQVTVRHKNWVAFKNQIFAYAKKFDDRVYAPLLHPDLERIPSYYDKTRFEIIENHLTFENGTMLDIGGHWGYFSHKFEDKGFTCYCIEKSKINCYFLERLKAIENKKFKVIPGSIFSLTKDIPAEYDVVLALSIFHHFIKEERTYKKFIKFLATLKASEMFFEPHNPNETQMKGAYKNFDNDGFADFIVQNSSFNKFEKIGTSEHGRNLYKIY
jgi:2-polyprenyl-3-methyl-5-hydroxy-6-metoxy-1,4-benzoquinol methylase